ncbi:MAG: DEAD/DEAH box helicase, partial [Chloroflexota bacterium]
MSLPGFHPAVDRWFLERFERPTAAQTGGWAEISAGRHTLIEAPTGSGKTLAAFLWCLNDLVCRPPDGAGVSVLYVSPLKALNNDIHRNLEAPLAGIAQAAADLGLAVPGITTDVRTGDTTASARARQVRRPPDILITTPESLYLLLTAGKSQGLFRSLRYVIVDEIHALAGSKRGVHLALSLERIGARCARNAEWGGDGGGPGPGARDRGSGCAVTEVGGASLVAGGGLEAGASFVRIGLSATIRPLDMAARLLGGFDDQGRPRPVAIVPAADDKAISVQVAAPYGERVDETDFYRVIARQILDEAEHHHSTLVFCNTRNACERLSETLNELAGQAVAMAHHGSLAKERRLEVEQNLKAGRLKILVATASLELGIDIGSIDFVFQLGSPRSVGRALQRFGRGGHQVGAVSRGRVLTLQPADLLDAAACARGLAARRVEATHVP